MGLKFFYFWVLLCYFFEWVLYQDLCLTVYSLKCVLRQFAALFYRNALLFILQFNRIFALNFSRIYRLAHLRFQDFLQRNSLQFWFLHVIYRFKFNRIRWLNLSFRLNVLVLNKRLIIRNVHFRNAWKWCELITAWVLFKVSWSKRLNCVFALFKEVF